MYDISKGGIRIVFFFFFLCVVCCRRCRRHDKAIGVLAIEWKVGTIGLRRMCRNSEVG